LMARLCREEEDPGRALTAYVLHNLFRTLRRRSATGRSSSVKCENWKPNTGQPSISPWKRLWQGQHRRNKWIDCPSLLFFTGAGKDDPRDWRAVSAEKAFDRMEEWGIQYR
jgi:hypothetical protein